MLLPGLGWRRQDENRWTMLLSAVSFAKSKSKTILVKLVSQAGTGFSFNHKRSRLREKLSLLHYDPIVNKKVLFVEQKKIRSL